MRRNQAAALKEEGSKQVPIIINEFEVVVDPPPSARPDTPSAHSGDEQAASVRPDDIAAAADPMDEQLRRTVIAWDLVAMPSESCVLWNLDDRVGVEEPWGIDLARVTEIQEAVTEIRVGVRN